MQNLNLNQLENINGGEGLLEGYLFGKFVDAVIDTCTHEYTEEDVARQRSLYKSKFDYADSFMDSWHKLGN